MLQLCNCLFNFQYRDDPTAVYMWIHLLCRAIEQDVIEGTEEPGTIRTSIAKLSESANLTHRKTRTALKKLASSGMVTSEATNHGRKITIQDYDRLTTPLSEGDKAGDKRKRLLAKASMLLEAETLKPEYCDQRGKLVVELPLNCGGIRTPRVHYYGGK